jgi:hypothetical protein
MTPDEIDKLEAGSHLDALVAQHVMGWTALVNRGKWWDGFPAGVENSVWNLCPVHRYSQDISLAWDVAEAIKAAKLPVPRDWDDGPWFTVSFSPKGMRSQGWIAGWTASGGIYPNGEWWPLYATAQAAPLAICRAALKAVDATATPAAGRGGEA